MLLNIEIMIRVKCKCRHKTTNNYTDPSEFIQNSIIGKRYIKRLKVKIIRVLDLHITSSQNIDSSSIFIRFDTYAFLCYLSGREVSMKTYVFFFSESNIMFCPYHSFYEFCNDQFNCDINITKFLSNSYQAKIECFVIHDKEAGWLIQVHGNISSC